jgi:hypothetical protein
MQAKPSATSRAILLAFVAALTCVLGVAGALPAGAATVHPHPSHAVAVLAGAADNHVGQRHAGPVAALPPAAGGSAIAARSGSPDLSTIDSSHTAVTVSSRGPPGQAPG